MAQAPGQQPVPPPRRLRADADYRGHVPVHVVWEITLACNLKCLHCGSRAGLRRPDELTTTECLEVVDALARLGTREVTLIGGEAYLRPDWTEIIAAVVSNGMHCAIQTGGRSLSDRRLQEAIDAGLGGLGVSVDGLEALHDELRGIPGSYQQAMSALRRARAAGLRTGANTQIGSRTMPDLEELLDRLVEAGASHWQLQLTVAMGNAVDHDELLLQPYELATLMPLLGRLYWKGLDGGLLIVPGNNIGYFGPYEHLWRDSPGERSHWAGCSAGQTVIALEADGTVKGCPSLPTVGYAGGNVRTMTLEDIWHTSPEIHFGRMRTIEQLSGFCRTCYYADVCRGGCTWTTHSLIGRPGNNPYCHYRVTELAKAGLRERIEKRSDAAPTPFAVGSFEIVREPVPGAAPEVPAVPATGPPPPAPAGTTFEWEPDGEGRVPPTLALCPSCTQFVWPSEVVCPFCSADLPAAWAQEEQDAARRRALMDEIAALLPPRS